MVFSMPRQPSFIEVVFAKILFFSLVYFSKRSISSSVITWNCSSSVEVPLMFSSPSSLTLFKVSNYLFCSSYFFWSYSNCILLSLMTVSYSRFFSRPSINLVYLGSVVYFSSSRLMYCESCL